MSSFSLAPKVVRCAGCGRAQGPRSPLRMPDRWLAAATEAGTLFACSKECAGEIDRELSRQGASVEWQLER